MNSADKRFQAEVTRQVREAVFASPAMAAEYRRRHAGAWRRTALEWLGAPWTIFAAVFLLPGSISFPSLVLLFPDLLETPQPIPPGGTDLVLAVQSIMIAAIACGLGAFSNSLFCSAGDLRTAAYFPVADRRLLQRSLNRWLIGLASFLYALSPVYAGIAWRDGLRWPQIGGAAALAVLQAWHLLALGAIIAHRLPTRSWLTVPGLIMALAAYFGSWGFAFLRDVPAVYRQGASFAALLLPTGWINGAMYYGVIQGSAAGYLFLAPVAVTSAYAAWWLGRGYAIREIRVSSQGEITPIFECGVANRSEAEAKAVAPQENSMPAAPDSDQAIEKRLLQSHALAPADWSQGWFIERWIGGLLTERERTLLEQFYGGRPRWTAEWWIFLAFAPFFVTLFAIVTVSDDERVSPWKPQPNCAIAAVVYGLVFECAAGRKRRSGGQVRGAPPLHPIFPIGLEETLAAVNKSLCLRASFLTPLLAAGALGANWLWPEGWLYAAATVFVGMMGIAAWHPIFARGQFVASNHLRFSWRRWFALGLVSVVGLLSFPCLFVIHPLVSPVLAALMLPAAWLACRQFDHLYLRTEFDFAAPESLTPIRRR